ncbi:hypothetical protein [Sporosarcina sp. BP05]|uniref:hypothetical protein n=1 Tax=Sporosarcina sp. BP05 TaxID=2758726 RepID=UPI001645D6A4|nr:hypothetical protein [Sporosarcina sp. BP05]
MTKNMFSLNYIDSIHLTGRMILNDALKLKLFKQNKLYISEILPREVFEEVEAFYNLLERRELRNDLVVLTTLSHSGLRIEVLLALKVSDINFWTNEN